MPSVPTRTFREPWGLVVNEAMHQRTPVIATDAVGAAAGGLVRDGRNGLVVPAGRRRRAGAAPSRACATTRRSRARLGAAGRAGRRRVHLRRLGRRDVRRAGGSAAAAAVPRTDAASVAPLCAAAARPRRSRSRWPPRLAALASARRAVIDDCTTTAS